MTRESVKVGQNSSVANPIDELIKKLVADEMREVGHELESLGALTSNNLESMKMYLQGEQAYRGLDYKEASNFFTKATELDSTFALAWMRLFEAVSWI